MKTVLLLFDFLGGGEIFIVLLAVLLLFGGKGMPTMMRNLGRGIRQFKDATAGIQRDLQDGANTMKAEMEKNANVIEEKAKEIEQPLNTKE